jgi:pSer/pThr/pTyr-binding forkhead associated (FHA) protein
MRNAELLFHSGPGREFAIPLSSPSVTIGRRLPADFLIDEDPAISSLHCRLESEGNGWVVIDLNSSNGTLVNGRRVTRHPLTEGDLIQAGNSQWVFRSRTTQEETANPNVAYREARRQERETPMGMGEPGTNPIRNSYGGEPVSIPQMRLHVLSGSQQGRVCWITQGQSMTIGRRVTADYVFPDDPLVAGNHCRIALNHDVCFLQDLDSLNGTWCNGIRVDHRELRNGDRLKLGQTDFLVELPGGGDVSDESSEDAVADPDGTTPPLDLRSLCLEQREFSPGFFRLTGTASIAQATHANVVGVLDQLLRNDISWYAIVDPGKIDPGIEDEDVWSEGILFDWLPDSASTQMPILLGHEDFDWRTVVEEGWSSDGLVILISDMEKEALRLQLQGEIAEGNRMSKIPERISGICWPSVLLSHLTVNVDSRTDRFLKGIVCVLIEDAAHPKQWHLLGKQPLLDLTRKLRLKVVDLPIAEGKNPKEDENRKA